MPTPDQSNMGTPNNRRPRRPQPRPAVPQQPTQGRPQAPAGRPQRPATPGQQRPQAPAQGRPQAPAQGRPQAPVSGRPKAPAGRRARPGSARQQAPATDFAAGDQSPRARRLARQAKPKSKMPWILAGVLSAVSITLVLILVLFPSPDEPTQKTLKEGYLDYINSSVTPAAIGVNVSNPEANAAIHYHKANVKYFPTHVKSKEFIRNISKWNEKYVDGEKVILKGKALRTCKDIYELCKPGFSCGKFDYFTPFSPKDFRDFALGCYSRDPVGTDQLNNIAQALQLLGVHYISKGNYKKGMQILKDRAMLGYQMSVSKNRAGMRLTGLEILKLALTDLANFTTVQADNKKYRELYDSAQSAFLDINSKYMDMWSINDECTGLNLDPGDLFNIIENDKDPAFVADACLLLGGLKTYVQSRGNRRHIEKLFERYKDSKYPAVKAAIKVARDDIKAMQDFIDDNRG